MTDKPATLIECLAHMPLPPSIPQEASDPRSVLHSVYGRSMVMRANERACEHEAEWRKESEALYSPAEVNKKKTYILDAALTERNRILCIWQDAGMC